MKYYTENENIKKLIDGAMDKIKTIVDSSTVVGEKVVTEDGTTIIPISKVTVGYVVGGGRVCRLLFSPRCKQLSYGRRIERRHEFDSCRIFGTYC